MSEPIRTWKFDKAPIEIKLLAPNTSAKYSFISSVPHSFGEIPVWFEYTDMKKVLNYNYYFH